MLLNGRSLSGMSCIIGCANPMFHVMSPCHSRYRVHGSALNGTKLMPQRETVEAIRRASVSAAYLHPPEIKTTMRNSDCKNVQGLFEQASLDVPTPYKAEQGALITPLRKRPLFARTSSPKRSNKLIMPPPPLDLGRTYLVPGTYLGST